MPTLTIGGHDVDVGDDFLNLPPDQQSATVDHIAQSLGVQPQLEGAGRLPAMAATNLAQGAAQGLGAIGDLQNIVQRGVNIPADALARLMGATPPANSPQSNLSSDKLVGYGRAAGIMDRPDLQPQNQGEQYLAAGAQGAGSVVPYLPLASGNLAVNALRGLAQGAAGGAAGEFGAQTFPEHPVVARLLGQLGGAAAGGAAFDAGNRLAGAAFGAENPTLEAYRNLGIDPRLAGDVTGSPGMQMVQAYAAKAPGGAGRIHSASEDAISQWGDALDRTAANFGDSRTLQDAGTALQGESRNWLANWRQAQQAAEAQVSAKVPATAAVDLAPVDALLHQASTTMPGLPSVAEIHTNPVFKNLSDAIAKDAANGIAPWSDVRAWRSAVGEELQKSLLSRDGEQGAWRQLYGSLSQALGDTANRAGAGAEWANANAISANGHDFVENVLGKFINNRNPARNTVSPEAAATAALSGTGSGGTQIAALRQQMPDAADELAAFKLRDMGLANAGKQDASGARLSPGTFLTDSNKLSPEAASALFLNDPQVRDLATVAGGMKQTEQFLNTSNTGTHAATGHAIGSAVAAPMAMVEGYHLGGIPGAAAGAVSTLALPYIPSYLAARAATSPALTRLLAAPAAAPVASGLLNRATMLPPLLRALSGAPMGLPPLGR